MRKLLFLISHLDYSGPAQRLCLLARGLPRDRFQVCVCVLQTETPWVKLLRADGIDVDILGWTRPIDPCPFLSLRQLLKTERPELLHVFGTTALRAWRMVGGRALQVVASDLLTGGRVAAGWSVDRWLLRGVARVLAFGAAEARRYRHYGIAEERIVTVTPGVTVRPAVGDATDWPAGRVILSVGPMTAHKGHRDAVWAFDILHYLYEDLRLVLLGDGPKRAAVLEFARAVGALGRVRFVEPQTYVEPYLQRAAAVWVPSRRAGGVTVALEALAAGRAVVAARVPELEEILVDEESGLLVPCGDKAALARQTRRLLDDAGLSRRLGQAGQQRVAEKYSAARLAADVATLYDRLLGL